MQKSLKIVAILNVTPDSFSDGGKYFDVEVAVKRGLGMIDSGIDIIDIGGESTRPGSTRVDAEEEIKRTIPVIKGILAQNPDAVISIDTTKSFVADEALKSGATIVNDVSGGSFDPEIWKVVANHGAKYILMHTSGTPDIMQSKTDYIDVVAEVKDYLLREPSWPIWLVLRKLFLILELVLEKQLNRMFC
ncbi:MAG: dihydropteroate synthase [Ignavibacteriales bacterium]|nr:dihydropteroate synthase [Ignavibacteriales bacterium]